MRYWKRVNEFGDTTTVESYSHNQDIENAVEITEQEFNTFIVSLPELVNPPHRDLAKEIDDLGSRIGTLEQSSVFDTGPP